MSDLSLVDKVAWATHGFVDNIVQFCRDFLSDYDKAVVAVMLGEITFLRIYDEVGISSSVVLPVMFGSLLASAFVVDRIWCSYPRKPRCQPQNS